MKWVALNEEYFRFLKKSAYENAVHRRISSIILLTWFPISIHSFWIFPFTHILTCSSFMLWVNFRRQAFWNYKLRILSFENVIDFLQIHTTFVWLIENKILLTDVHLKTFSKVQRTVDYVHTNKLHKIVSFVLECLFFDMFADRSTKKQKNFKFKFHCSVCSWTSST